MKKGLFKVVASSLGLFLLTTGAFAQDEAAADSSWSKGGVFSLNFTQSSFTNWAAGGQNAISGVGLVNLYANYKKDKVTWDNTLDMAYGLIKQGEADIFKSDDRIDFSSKYGRQASEHWYYSGLLNFKTQFTEGFSTPEDSVRISNLLAPGYTILAIGMDYKPNKNFSMFISPITGKITFVQDQTLANAGAFGVEPAKLDTAGKVITKGENIRYEFGGFIKIAYQKDIMENIKLGTKVDLFSNYLENPQNIDVNWEMLISLKVNKYISASISTQLIYDDDIDILDADDRVGPRTQFKEVLGVGFSYQF